jgi:carboxylesterase type B
VRKAAARLRAQVKVLGWSSPRTRRRRARVSWFAHVPVINGITHDEELLFVDLVYIAVSGGTDAPVPGRPVTSANYQTDIAWVLTVTGTRAAAIAAEYPLSAYPSPDVAFSTLVSDANFACPALQVDRWTATRVPTYAYQFNDPAMRPCHVVMIPLRSARWAGTDNAATSALQL